jgi:hypothetical protein
VLAYQYLQTLPLMAQGDANKVWLIPSDFNKSLEGFARMLGAPGEDGVFRYEPPAPDPEASRAEDDDAAIADWFDTSTDARIAEAVRKAEAVVDSDVSAGSPVPPMQPAPKQTYEQPAGIGPSVPQSPMPGMQFPIADPDSERTQAMRPPPQHPGQA